MSEHLPDELQISRPPQQGRGAEVAQRVRAHLAGETGLCGEPVQDMEGMAPGERGSGSRGEHPVMRLRLLAELQPCPQVQGGRRPEVGSPVRLSLPTSHADGLGRKLQVFDPQPQSLGDPEAAVCE